jgi:hypothetical protein
MTAFCRAYPDLIAAGRATEALRATGVPHDAIRLISGRRRRDLRTEPAGGFAGPVLPDAPVGTFGNRQIRRRDGAGTFAGDARTQRQGSFVDSDHAEIVDFGEGGERTRVTGLRGVRRLLGRAALDPDASTARSPSCTRGTRSCSSTCPRTPQARPTTGSSSSVARPDAGRSQPRRPAARRRRDGFEGDVTWPPSRPRGGL